MLIFKQSWLERKARRLLWEYGGGETPQEQSDEEAPQTAHEPLVPGAEINNQV